MNNVSVLNVWGVPIFTGYTIANRPSFWSGWTRVYLADKDRVGWEIQCALANVRSRSGTQYIATDGNDYVDLAPEWPIRKEETVSNIEDAQARIKKAQAELEAAQRDLEAANKPTLTPSDLLLEKLSKLESGTLFTLGTNTHSASIRYFMFIDCQDREKKIQSENGRVRTLREMADFNASKWDTIYIISEYK